jgi:hypothetical protein
MFIGCTFADAHLKEGDIISENPLVACNHFNNLLFYRKQDKLKIGFEASYNSWQAFTGSTSGKPFWTFGLMPQSYGKASPYSSTL